MNLQVSCCFTLNGVIKGSLRQLMHKHLQMKVFAIVQLKTFSSSFCSWLAIKCVLLILNMIFKYNQSICTTGQCAAPYRCIHNLFKIFPNCLLIVVFQSILIIEFEGIIPLQGFQGRLPDRGARQREDLVLVLVTFYYFFKPKENHFRGFRADCPTGELDKEKIQF